MKTLNETHPELAKEWNYELNGDLKPEHVTFGSSKTVWWKCNKASDHCWQAQITNRSKISGTTCPCCCNRKVVPSNCLQTSHPELCKEWSLNNKISPDKITCGYSIKVEWQCSLNKEHLWLSTPFQRSIKKYGCPYCSRKKVFSTGHLVDTHPHIAKEWHEELNVLKANQVNYGSRKKVWWKCRNNALHKWEATVNNRTSKNHPCPYCVGKKADSTTSFLAKHPDLCQEWDDPSDPNEFLPNSHKKVWWKCKKDNLHRWKCNLNNRVSNLNNCPYCQESNGEILIRTCLVNMEIKFSRQYRFPDCRHKRTLPFDFAVHGKKLGVIEFQGEQHFEPVNLFGGRKDYLKRIERDQIKKKYCNDNLIPFLEILYNQKEKIPTLLKNFIESL